MKLCFATHNINKLKEIREILEGKFEVVSLDEIGQTDEIPETGRTLEENSLLKAEFVFRKFRVAVIADDSGLEVESLNGEPGVYSARYAGSQKNSEDNMNLLLSNLRGHQNKQACFKAVITYIDEQGTSAQFVGQVDGKIIDVKRGSGGFGYDPIFVPDGYDRTFAEMSNEEKNTMSHRARALEKFLNFLK